jgi:hypothetical protein
VVEVDRAQQGFQGVRGSLLPGNRFDFAAGHVDRTRGTAQLLRKVMKLFSGFD